MPVLTRYYANFIRAISCTTTDRSARNFTRREPGRTSSGQSRRSSSCESCRTGTAADNGKPASRGTCGPRRNYYRYLKSRCRR